MPRTSNKQTKQKAAKSMEAALWESCNKLRGAVEPAEYKHVVLSLIFLKYAGDRFELRKQELIDMGLQEYIDQVEFYTAENVFYLPEECRWSYIMQNAKQPNIFQIIDDALSNIEKKNKQLAGALPNNYYSNLGLDRTKFASLLDEINKLDTVKDAENDLIGRVYEYFLGKFAIAEGKGKGEYYTPKSVVNLIAELIEPYDGKIYDPCCGSGGMFVQSMKFVQAHNGNQKNISVYGQENTNTTFKLARMNLAIRGISADIRQGDTFHNDQHKDLKADYIMANPPFNQKDWRDSNQLMDDPRWQGYDTPPTSNANYGWILNILSKLSTNGVAGFLLANGALSADGTELAIRKKLIENDKVEAILILPRNLFYSTDISVTLWILNNNKKAHVVTKNGQEIHFRDRENEILFMDLRQMGIPFEKKYIELDPETRDKVALTYHHWQQEGYEQTYQNEPEYCYSATLDEIEKKGWSLVPSKYIEFRNRDEQIDFDAKMKQLQAEMRDLLQQEEESRQQLKNLFEKLGYNL
jgi:type I restriction enzyme M protein